MKKGFLILALAGIIALSSCRGPKKAENVFIDAGLADFVEPEGKKSKESTYKTIKYKGSKDDFDAYVNDFYDYLKGKNYKYLGTSNHTILDSLFGATPTYDFKEGVKLEDFYHENDDYIEYVFVAFNEVYEDNKSADDIYIQIKYRSGEDFPIVLFGEYNEVISYYRLDSEEETNNSEEANN